MRIAALALLLASPVRAAESSAAREAADRAIRRGSAASEALEAAEFVRLYSGLYQAVASVASEANWQASTDVTPAHDAARVAANKALAALTGSPEVIARARALMRRSDIPEPTRRQVEKILLAAAENPGTLPEVVARRIEAESRQSSTLDSYPFCLERKGAECGRPTTANEIDDLLVASRDLPERLKVWTASKEIGPQLRPGLAELQGLRNQVARHFGYSSFYGLQVADYGMSVAEMTELLEGFLKDIGPLYRELHCWTKHELAGRYKQPVPKLIPAHWLGNRWAQNWTGVVEGVDLDPLFKDKSPEWIVRQAEAFYVSMGFPRLPESFWTKSDLYPVPKDSKRAKNTHASAWHVDLSTDVRSLMSVEPDARWFGTAHHELGHIYYYLSYARPEVPVLLRAGANRAFHEGIGELINIAAMQVPYLRSAGILPEGRAIDQNRWLLNEALDETITFLPWSAGAISSWERDLYELDMPERVWNREWWRYVRKFQGVEPPGPRGEEHCDACTKTHVSDDPAQYYDYAIATVLKYQLHTHICRSILKQDPHACNYFGSREAGAFLRGLLEPGATRDWRQLLKEKTGSELSTKPMMDYFEPLTAYLREQNAGRSCGWE